MANRMLKRGSFLTVAMLALTCLFMSALPQPARADDPPTNAAHGTCTTDPTFTIPDPGPGKGIISSIIIAIQNVLSTVSSALFLQIIGDSGFIMAVKGLTTLYIAFYGIMFTFGMVQITLFDFSIRMIKIGIIAALLSPSAWSFFNGTVVAFFNSGTDEWINQVSAAVLNQAVPSNAPPFYTIDTALAKVISAKMAVTMMAMFFTMPYGPIFGGLLALSLGKFVRAILTAAWVYLMSLILKALLFGIAPIFLSFLLFTRTRYLFDGWLNQVVNATLQPILLFTFLGFFVQLISVAIDNILLTPVCWTEWAQSLVGTPFSMHYWRFALCLSGGGDYCQPFSGSWSYDGVKTAAGQGPIFPIDILGVLVLLMLADLASRFNSIVTMIASDLSGAATSLAGMQGEIGGLFNKATQKGTQSLGGLGGKGAQLPIQKMKGKGKGKTGTSLAENDSGDVPMPGRGGGDRGPMGPSNIA